MKTIWVSAFLLVFIAIGASILAQGIRSVQRSRAAQYWPTAEAKIEWVELRPSSGDETTTYELKLAYTYQVAGRNYTGTDLAFGYHGSRSHESEDALYQKLAHARYVMARYNPEDPSQACLTWGIVHSQLTSIVFGAIWLFFVFGVITLLYLSSSADSRLLQRLIVLQ